MFRKPFCMLLCLVLALCALPAPAQAENAAQLYDFNGDGQMEELRCSVADTVLTLQVGAVSAEVALNDFSDTYILAIADLDASDAFMEIAVGNEGNSGEYPASTVWQIWRYDGSRLYPLTVVTDAGEADRLTQYGYAGDGMRPLKASGTGDVYVPSAGIIWIQPFMWDQAFTPYEEHYRLEGDQLVLQPSSQFYPVTLRETLASAGDTPAYATTASLTLYATPDRAGEVITIPAGMPLMPVEASPSGWLRLRAADSTEGYIWQEPGWNECLDANGQVFSDAVEIIKDEENDLTGFSVGARQEELSETDSPTAPRLFLDVDFTQKTNATTVVTVKIDNQATLSTYLQRLDGGVDGKAAQSVILSVEYNNESLSVYLEGGNTPEDGQINTTLGEIAFGDTVEKEVVVCKTDSFQNESPITIRVQSSNAGSAEYTCLLDGNTQMRALLIAGLGSQTEGEAALKNDLSMMETVFKQCSLDGQAIPVTTLWDPEDFWDEISVLESMEIDGNDLTYIYINAHGASNALGFFMNNSDDSKYGGQIVYYKSLFEYALEYIPGQVVFLLDSCYSGWAVDVAEDMVLDDRIHIITATRNNAPTGLYDFFSLGYGWFTKELHDGALKRYADANLDNVITLGELYDYISERGERPSMQLLPPLDPQMRGERDIAVFVMNDENFENIEELVPKKVRTSYVLPEDDKENDTQSGEGRTIIQSIPEADPAVTWRDDFDKDGVEEAFYLSGGRYNGEYGELVYTELWYADVSGTQYLESAQAICFSNGRVYDVGECKIFCVEDNYTSSNETHVWIVRNGSPMRIHIAYGQQPGNILQESDTDFSFIFDGGDGNSMGHGHTWKRYYMYWNGDGFTEYGGLRISEEQLRAVEGASRWLDEILAVDGMIGDIFYRENGIVNINYTTTDGWTDGTVNNKNVTLRIVDGMAQLVYDREETLQDSNHGGVYAANVLDNAIFPESFPFGGSTAEGAQDAANMVPAGYELLDEVSADLDGDGEEEFLSFCRVSDDYGGGHIALCVFRATGEMIHTFDLQAYSQYSNYAIRVYLVPAAERQRVFLESISFDGDVHSKYYSLLGYDNGLWSEEVTVRDYGYSDSTGLYGVFEPEGEEIELFYDEMAYSPADCQDEYLITLEGSLGRYGISFEFAEGYAFEPDGAAYYGPFGYYKAVLPTECIWQWEQAPFGAAENAASLDSEASEGNGSGLLDTPLESTGITFAQYDEYAPWGGGVEGAPLVAVDAGAQRWAEYSDAMGGLAPIGGMQSSCSSYRSSNRYPCDASCAFDGDASSAWNSNNSRSGQWLRVEWPQSQKIAGFTFVNGYAKDTEVWQNNSRVRLFSIYVNDEDYLGSFYLDDDNQTQFFPLDGSIECTSLLFQFDETYAGDRYDDLCVTEIQFYGAAGSSGNTSLEGASTQQANPSQATSEAQSVRTTGNVNLRSGPGTEYQDLDTISRGTTVTYLGESDSDNRGVLWLKVRYNGKDGWISSKYGHVLEENGGSTVRATNGDTYLRSGPGLHYERLDVLHIYESATYLGAISTDERGVDWYKVRMGTKEGWVSSKYTVLS